MIVVIVVYHVKEDIWVRYYIENPVRKRTE